MARCRVDETIDRVVNNGFAFPLGVYPTEEMKPVPGYTVEFEAADGDNEEGEWEEWPDRYVFDIVIGAERVEPLCRALFAMLPGRVFPILDVLGQDAYREVDPYISYELVGMDRVTDALRRFRGFFFEDGLVGFGVMIDEPFLYVFVDEHKIVTVRVETAYKEKVEKILRAFDLEPVEHPAGVDSAAHEHRGVLIAPDDRPDLLTSEEIVETLRDQWRLTLNIDGETNVDEEGNDLGITGWRCIVRSPESEGDRARYAQILLTAGNLNRAEDLAIEAAEELASDPSKEAETELQIDVPEEFTVVSSDRVTPEVLVEMVAADKKAPQPGKPEELLSEEGIKSRFWLE